MNQDKGKKGRAEGPAPDEHYRHPRKQKHFIFCFLHWVAVGGNDGGDRHPRKATHAQQNILKLKENKNTNQT